MRQILSTAVLFISNYLSVNVVMFQRENANLSLPSPYATSYENELVCQQLESAPQNSYTIIKDKSFIRYCFVFVDSYIMLIGPFRSETLRKSSLPAYLTMFPDKRESFHNFYNSLPYLTTETVKQSVHLTFLSIYGTSDSVKEKFIDIQEYLKDDIFLPEDESQLSQPDFTFSESESVMYFLNQIEHGNYIESIAMFRNLMHSRGNPFVLINTIEGLSSMRAQIQIALTRAGVPKSSIFSLLQHYKFAGRVVTNNEYALHLSEQLIEKSCALVRKHRQQSYSPSIAAAMDYIQLHLAQPVTVAEIAHFVGFTPNSLSSKFSAEVGMPPTAYILQQRMQNAANLLIYTNMNMQNICTKVGFFDSNYFARCFKKIYHMSPSEYRKRGVIE